jgi:1-acyl-sn-glycerol-3-phosphate acyltransferase
MPRPEVTLMYRSVMFFSRPILRWWARLEARNVDLVPLEGPVLILANHDSYWDTVAVGEALLKRRQIQALAKSELWKNPAVGWVLNGMRQIPVKRGSADAAHALDAAIEVLKNGGCIGIFPEGGTSRGQVRAPRSGAGRLLLAVPETRVVCVRITGTVDVARFPKRPKIVLEFFEPAGGQAQPGETAQSMAKRFTTELRHGAPPQIAGRKRKVAKARAALEQAAKPDVS